MSPQLDDHGQELEIRESIREGPFEGTRVQLVANTNDIAHTSRLENLLGFTSGKNVEPF